MKTNINDIMFPVKEVPAAIVNSNNVVTSHGDTGYKFIMREDTGQILSCMTNNYKLVKNEFINKKSANVIKKNGGRIKEVQTFGNGARSVVKWEFPKHKVTLSKKDEMTPEIIWQNSYDGTIGLNIIAGAFRLICLNGAVIGVVATKYRNKHIVQNMALNDIEGVIDETINKTKIIMKEEFPLLFDTKVRDHHILKMLKLFPLTSSEYITQKLIESKPENLWDLFNVSTNVATHGLDRKMESTHKLESKLYNLVKSMATKGAARA